MNQITEFLSADKEVALLLGAGASIDAGIPGAYDLTEKLYSRFQERFPHQSYSRMFAYVVSGIQQNNTINGRSPFDLPNVEEIISAIELISSRHKLEASPFIGSWLPRIELFEKAEFVNASALSQSFSSAFKTIFEISQKAFNEVLDSMDNAFRRDPFSSGAFTKSRIGSILSNSSSKLDQTIREIEQQLNQILIEKDKPTNTWFFLYQYTHALLTELMWVTDAVACEYLKPMLELPVKKTHLFTLNYDTCIEAIAQSSSIPISDGFENISGRPVFKRKFDENIPVHYIKLHGSINWLWNDRDSLTSKLAEKPRGEYMPLLVFGQREKLRSKGPFLDLLFEFQSRLKRCDTVIAIGYSFLDDHINKFIFEWLETPENRLILACGPEFAHPILRNVNRNIVNTKLRIKEFLGA